MDKAELPFEIKNSRKWDSKPIIDMSKTSNEVKKLKPLFNKLVSSATSFPDYLEKTFDKDTAEKVVAAFEKMGLPLPREEEFLKGQEGALVFLNRYGVIIRVECPDADGEYRSDRINNSDGVLKPLASVEAGMATIELCPGLRPEKKRENNEQLRRQLKNDGIEFWDYKLSNTGRLPIKTARFPEGIPVVVDRGAVRRLTDSVDSVRMYVMSAKPKSFAEKLETAQESLYAPLRRAFEAGWIDAAKMKGFWELCQSYLQQEKLFAGWNENLSSEAMDEKCRYGDNFKNRKAAHAAANYEGRLQDPAREKPAKPAIRILYSSIGMTV